jgi:hypothetical protein
VGGWERLGKGAAYLAVRFWQWAGVCFVFAGVPFALKFIVARSYGQRVNLVDVFGNADLCLLASLLSCAGLLELYLSIRRTQTEGAGLFIMTLAVAIFAIGYYAAVSRTFPNPAEAGASGVAWVSAITYLLAIVFSWFIKQVVEQGRLYGPR